MLEETFVLIDTDAGTDDALAIFMCLRAHKATNRKFKVVGIVCVNGNTNVDNVTRNVSRILDTVGLKDEIPVFRGCEAPIVFPYENKSPLPPFHGADGFGDTSLQLEHVTPKVNNENGVLATIRFAHQYKGRLTILALGPMTNLAMAVRLDPSIKDAVSQIYSMGGNVEGVGNVTVSGEFNFVVDPEAAYITLSTYACPIHIVPWEVCLRQGTRTLKWRTDVLGALDTPASHLLKQIEAKILMSTENSKGWIPCDQLAAAVLIESDVVKKMVSYHCTVELEGRHTRGLMVVDYPSLLNQKENVNIIFEINAEILEKVMVWGAGGAEYKIIKL